MAMHQFSITPTYRVGDWFPPVPTFTPHIPMYPVPFFPTYQPIQQPWEGHQPLYPTIPSLPLPASRPHTCPVCGGKGTVPAGFYENTIGSEDCRTCGGKGVIWG
jgi:hypothetical protein